MEVLSIELGRSIQLVVPDEVRSTKGISVPEATRLLVDRYGFAVLPDIQEAQKSGLKFREGRLIAGNRMINIKELGVYNDGIVADTYNTDDSDFVVDHVIEWAKQVLGMRDPKTIISRRYLSHIVAILDQRAVDGLEPVNKMNAISAEAMKVAYQLDVPMALAGMSWNSDIPLSAATVSSADFNFFRRIGRPYSENRFFFMAPIPTDAHIRWIADLEKVFIGEMAN